jgi:hypothetical protein
MHRLGTVLESRASFRLPVLQQRCKDTTFFGIGKRFRRKKIKKNEKFDILRNFAMHIDGMVMHKEMKYL